MEAHAAGWLGQRFGSRRARKFVDLIEPAAAYAEEGFAVGQKIAHVWEWGSSKLRLSEHSTEEYLLQGRVPKPGEIFRQRNLARTWRELGRRGRDHFYEGELARRIVAASDAGGGLLKLPDLAAQRSEWIEPISTTYRGQRVVEMPPNGQGLIVLLALRILEGLDVAGLFQTDPAAAQHVVLEALKLSFADAESCIGDPRFDLIEVEKLLSDAFITSRRHLIRMDKALPTPSAGRRSGYRNRLGIRHSLRSLRSAVGWGGHWLLEMQRSVLNQSAKSVAYRNIRNPANLGPFLYLSLVAAAIFDWILYGTVPRLFQAARSFFPRL
jgi:gamma-glutamyltranspeptidase/glutathione hydrolase